MLSRATPYISAKQRAGTNHSPTFLTAAGNYQKEGGTRGHREHSRAHFHRRTHDFAITATATALPKSTSIADQCHDVPVAARCTGKQSLLATIPRFPFCLKACTISRDLLFDAKPQFNGYRCLSMIIDLRIGLVFARGLFDIKNNVVLLTWASGIQQMWLNVCIPFLEQLKRRVRAGQGAVREPHSVH